MDDDTRPFPIQGEFHSRRAAYRPSKIPWWLAELAYDEYVRQVGNDQTLERLAQRGGFGRTELVRLLRREKLT